MWRSAPVVLSLVRSLIIHSLWHLMIRILSVHPRILRVASGILRIIWRYRGERDVRWHRRALVVRPCAIVFFSWWWGVLSRRWRVLRFSEIARVSRWRIRPALLVRIRHVVIDRHRDGLIGETLASKVCEMESLDGVCTCGCDVNQREPCVVYFVSLRVFWEAKSCLKGRKAKLVIVRR